MSFAKVLRLEDYRGKRAHRLRLADGLYSADPRRLAIFRHLGEVAALCDADRAATVWVDEYGPGSVHPHVVLDQTSDRPRRFFSVEPLRRAWELGVPGAIDALADPASSIPTTFAISLGSDGMRAWFLVAESTAGRPLLDAATRDRLMFLAGECAAVLLHRDMDALLPAEDRPSEAGFAGWPILKDLEGRESDETEGRRIAQRFVVGRVVRMLADDDFVILPERMTEQVRRARTELPEEGQSMDAEAALWHRTLDRLDERDLEGLARELVDLGQTVERQEHGHGALELYDCAYHTAVAVCDAGAAAEAAWYSGRVLRRRAARVEATERYQAALRIAEAAGLADTSVNVLVGLALLKQDLGNLPAARATLDEALTVAESAVRRDTLAVVHHSYMGLEQLAGNVCQGLEHGWVAVATYEDAERRIQCMASLGGLLIDHGDRDAAEDAWTVVAHTSSDRFYLIYAHDALAHLSALRGDAIGFEEHAARCDELDWENASRSVKAEILYYRGLSYRSLGRLDEAEAWLGRALTFAEEHGFNHLLFRAEEALASSSSDRSDASGELAIPTTPDTVRNGLRTMREELVGVGA
jgi:tetratricopeptide (TPR) repeat protein